MTGPDHGIRRDLDPLLPDSGAGTGLGALQPPPDNNTATPWTNLGMQELPVGVNLHVRVSGKLTFVRNQDYVTCINLQPPFQQGFLPGNVTVVGPGGDSSYYRVTVGVGTATAAPVGNIMHSADVNAESTTATIGVSGPGKFLWAGRPAVFPIACSYHGGVSYPGYQPVTGAQIVSATALPPPVITVDRTTVAAGDTVNATVSASWTTNLDLWYAGWQWVADTAPYGGGASFVSCTAQTPTCRASVLGDGHFRMPNIQLDGSGIYVTAVSPTIHVGPARLTLTVDSSHIASGSRVKFTARRSDARPVQVRSWVWTPGSTGPVGPLARACAGSDSLCITVLSNTSSPQTGVTQTGTMMAIAYVGTAAESASASVAVDRPPPGGGGGGAMGGVSLSLAARGDSLHPLYPRIRGLPVNGVVVPEHPPDTTPITMTLTQGGVPVPTGTLVTFRAEWLPNTGGHAHIRNAVRFDGPEAPLLTTGPEQGRPVFGYFIDSSRVFKQPSMTVAANSSGRASVWLVAGYLGGRARIIASAAVGSQVLEDTGIATYAVPGLVNLQTRIPVGDVYWIGGNNDHVQGSNFYVQDSIALRLDTLARSMWKGVGGQQLYLQYNDASLPNGGTLTVTPTNAVRFENPYIVGGGHTAHNTGLDQDVGFCYTTGFGDDGGRRYRLGYTACLSDTSRTVDGPSLHTHACPHAAAEAHRDSVNGQWVVTHYHIRFAGSTDTVTSCR